MSANAETINGGAAVTSGKHPKGLYVLFATEMWERFSFYSMLSLFTLYLRTDFGFTGSEATTLNANYLMFVYASPLIGGLIADRITGYRKAVMIGGVFFMLGHGLLSIPTLWAVYLALTCLVIGNGFFKPNVSTMVGNLYPEGSHLKDRAYNIFYMGINIGAFAAPIVMQIVKDAVSVHAAFAVAAFGMLISVGTLWYFKQHVLHTDKKFGAGDNQAADTAATAVDMPPHGVSDQGVDGSTVAAGRSAPLTAGLKAAPVVIALILLALGAYFFPGIVPIKGTTGFVIGVAVAVVLGMFGYLVSRDMIGKGDSEAERNPGVASTPLSRIPDWKRAFGLVVIFLVVIVFWMVFHQNSSTLTYFAEDNTSIPGTISQAINAFWVLALTFPLVWFWGWLDRKGMEPSTPTKMAFGMTLTGLSFLVLWIGAGIGESAVKTPAQIATGDFRINERAATNLKAGGMPAEVIDKIMEAKDAEGKKLVNGVKFASLSDDAIAEREKENLKEGKPAFTEQERTVLKSGQTQMVNAVNAIAPGAGDQFREPISQNSYLFKVAAFWLILGYMIVTLGELMLSPMGLSLVSKVAPVAKRGLLMGGWFVATAIGNKLTQIGIFWDVWLQSTFFLVLACMALVMAVVLFAILKPLKKAMPGV